jgi:hypothetical protein
VLNHVLPALAKVKPDVAVTVEYVPDSSSPNSWALKRHPREPEWAW